MNEVSGIPDAFMSLDAYSYGKEYKRQKEKIGECRWLRRDEVLMVEVLLLVQLYYNRTLNAISVLEYSELKETSRNTH